MKNIIQKMSLVKSTKNTHVYNSDETLLPSAIPTLYISKLSLPESPPKNIEVKITAVEK